ncbi:histidinol-phosphate transaminase [Leptospira weilii str. 2006001853]|uniref:Histidinol-phosphate aminotransferase n=3 Tax=Leptospira weilii TaxID=28184 RepID=A0A828YX90_9LEPT|nr:histidinol-phosphate transaminase [Leptospira weilii]EKR63162.1 histidinol-phosphate transaminase [Leptospira weilii str. 2006001853]EMN43233.1 histidinol-phosphate transaminase [Leptospira weilii str. LNT 1234]MCL8267907.1 histidinol-phosphate transaminase [Leptospira weilii]MDL5246998.1 histidinol-phosphate transaminase [Leptospira weilii]OMI18209.1 histidinol-phosphate transaminase [Leptospira weilii serovar Heyan]
MIQFQSVLGSLKSYEAGKPIELIAREFGIDPNQIIKLGSNENPFGCAQPVIEAVQKAASKMSYYPDDSYSELKTALASKFDLTPDRIIPGNGSDQVLDFACRCVLGPGDSILINRITFAMYKIYALQCGAKVHSTETVLHDLNAFSDLAKSIRPKIIFLCTPSNPIGDALSKLDVYDFLRQIPSNTLVVIDAAYMEFGKKKDSNTFISAKEITDLFPNVFYTGTFSKAYGLGGMRIGYGIGSKELISNLYKMRPPFNVANLSALAATEALKNESHVESYLDNNLKEMKRYEKFAAEQNVEFVDSYSNFITFFARKRGKSSTEISQSLLKQGIILRDLRSYDLNAIRITIGRPEQNDRVLTALEREFS